MGDRQRGRPHEDAGPDHYTASEAAEIIGVTDDTVRAMVKDGRLIGEPYRTMKNEPRYRATKESVHAEAARRGNFPTNADVERVVRGVVTGSREQILTTVQKMFAEIIADSDERTMKSFANELAKNREFAECQIQSLTRTMVEQHAQTREAINDLTTLMREVKEAENERQDRGLSERRGFFRRLFGG